MLNYTIYIYINGKPIFIYKYTANLFKKRKIHTRHTKTNPSIVKCLPESVNQTI